MTMGDREVTREFEGVEVSYRVGCGELHAVAKAASAVAGDLPAAMLMGECVSALQGIVEKAGGAYKPVFARCFLSDAANHGEAAREVLARLGCAVSIVQQPPQHGRAALWLWAMENATSEQVRHDTWRTETEHGTHFFSVTRPETMGGPYGQTRELLEGYSRTLEDMGLSLERNCQRTWFFVSDIDNNYQGLVQARNDIFNRHGLTTDTHFISSTGIAGCSGKSGQLVIMDAYAFAPKGGCSVGYLYAPAHLNRTSDYGVSFERGTVLGYGGESHIFISGTASIDNKGGIVHSGVSTEQFRRMAENVNALLAEAGCTADDIVSAIVYIRDTADFHNIGRLCREYLKGAPYVLTLAPVCRPGWLVEMECMAVKGRRRGWAE